MKHTTKFLALLLALGLLLTACAGQPDDQSAPAADSADHTDSTDSSAGDGGEAGEEPGLRSFSAATLDGGSFSPEDIAAKDVTVINFWALSCAPCIAEMPDLAAFAAALPENVGVATVCLDGYGDQETALEVLEGTDLVSSTVISGNGDLASLCSALIYTPTTVLVDGEGHADGGDRGRTGGLVRDLSGGSEQGSGSVRKGGDQPCGINRSCFSAGACWGWPWL